MTGSVQMPMASRSVQMPMTSSVQMPMQTMPSMMMAPQPMMMAPQPTGHPDFPHLGPQQPYPTTCTAHDEMLLHKLYSMYGQEEGRDGLPGFPYIGAPYVGEYQGEAWCEGQAARAVCAGASSGGPGRVQRV